MTSRPSRWWLDTLLLISAHCPVVFADPQFTTLYSFGASTDSSNPDGGLPTAGLIFGADGALYGIDSVAGKSYLGTVFRVTTAGAEATVVPFNSGGTYNDKSSLVLLADGRMCGTAESGGTNGSGYIYCVTAGALSIMYSFTAVNSSGVNVDGASPRSALVQGPDNALYGMTYVGGANGGGTIYRFGLDGSFTVLHAFAGPDGNAPIGALVLAGDGNFYGTALGSGAAGGAGAVGTAFCITPSGVFTVLATFNGTNGLQPQGSLTVGADGNFYGSTIAGGASNAGTVFQMTPSGTITVLHSFNGTDGQSPNGGLVQGSDGNFYGTTYGGGATSQGVVFQLSPAGAFAVLHAFSYSGQPNAQEGAYPNGGLVRGSDGTLYGTTLQGGIGTCCGGGTIFKVTGAAVAAATPPSVTLLDPVPLNATATSMLAGAAVTSDPTVLAAQGRAVTGVAADGVAQIVVRIPATIVGEHYTLTLSDSSQSNGSTTGDGGLYALGSNPLTSTATSSLAITAIETNTTGTGASVPMAFALYLAPTDFARGSSDYTLASRSVQMTVTDQDLAVSSTVSINIVRPPVILIHGIWSSAQAWASLGQSLHAPNYSPSTTEPFWVQAIDYGSAQSKGVNGSLPVVHQQMINGLTQFRSAQKVAAAQADLIVHSLGGLVARALTLKAATPSPVTPAFIRPANYNLGDIHKLITLDTPHLGSEFADVLVNSSKACQDTFAAGNSPVNQSVQDLRPSSVLLQSLSQNTAAQHVVANVVVSTATTAQATNTQTNFYAGSGLSGGILYHFCSNLLPAAGFAGVFVGDGDLVVSTKSQSATNLAVAGGSPPATPMAGYIHSADPTIFKFGPDIVGRNVVNGQLVTDSNAQTDITTTLVQLLNSPADGPSYAPLLP